MRHSVTTARTRFRELCFDSYVFFFTDFSYKDLRNTHTYTQVLNANQELVKLFRELRQRRVPLNTRLQVCEKNMRSSASRADFVWRKLRWRSVRSFYERLCLGDNLISRWKRWKEYVKARRLIKKAEAYRVKFCKRKTVQYFRNFVQWRCENRRRRLMARKHFVNYTLTYRFYEWYRFHDESKRRRIENMKIAADFHRKRALRKYVNSLRK